MIEEMPLDDCLEAASNVVSIVSGILMNGVKQSLISDLLGSDRFLKAKAGWLMMEADI